MKKIRLKSGNQIPVLGFGTYKLKGEDGVKAVKTAIDLGYKHLDTAESYNNQTEVSHAIEKSGISRDELFITSKVSYENLHYDDVITACENTLDELNTEYLDLYLIHWPNKNIPIEETMRALSDLKQEGKIKDIGVSNFTRNHLEEVKEVSDEDIVVNQVEFHPYLYQKELYDYCMDNGIYITAYSPIARGDVFGDSLLSIIAKKHGKNEAQIALRWMMQKDIIVIPRSSNPEHIKSNFELFDFELSDDEVSKIDSLDRQERLIDPSWGEFDYR
ncbi:MAG: aldo/keto reductase [Halanaerobiales bacterium]